MKLKKWVMCFNLLFMLGMGYSITAMAASEKELNNTLASANTIGLDDVLNGEISEKTEDFDKDCYKLVLPSTGHLSINMTSYMAKMQITLIDATGNNLSSNELEWNSALEMKNNVYAWYLEKGTYYIEVNGYKEGVYNNSGTYQFKTSFATSNVNTGELNHSFTKAEEVKYNVTYHEALTLASNDGDWFKITVPTGKLLLDTTSNTDKLCIAVYDSKGNDKGTNTLDKNTVTEVIEDTLDYDVEAGTYYIKFSSYKLGLYNYTGNYSFKLTEPIYVDAIKLSNTTKNITSGGKFSLTATIAPSEATYNSVTWESSDTKIASVDVKGNVTTKAIGAAVITAKATDGSGKTATCSVYSKIAKPSIYSVEPKTYESIYFLWSAVPSASSYEVYRATSVKGEYTKVKTTKNSYCTINKQKTGNTYYYKVKAVNSGYSGKCNSFLSGPVKGKMILSKPSFNVAQSTKNKIKLTCAKVNGATGYQIYRKTGSKGTYKKVETHTKGAAFTYSKGKLKNNTTYYFKVRAYRTIKGKKVYSEWSYQKTRVSS